MPNLWIAATVISLGIFVVFFAKRVVIAVISWLLARLLRCSSVKYKSVGLFSVTDIKLYFYFFKVEVDKVWLSSCFFNQDFTKPLVICLGEIRIEVNKKVADSATRINQNQQLMDHNTLQQRLKKLRTILQYVSAKINNLNIALMDVVLPGFLVHLAIEQIHFDTFRDKESIQCDILWKLVTCKMLQRFNESVGGLSVDMQQGANLTVYFDPYNFAVKFCSFKCTNTVVGVSDEFFQLFKRNENAEDPKMFNKSMNLTQFYPRRMHVDTKSVSLTFLNASTKRQLDFSLKSFLFDFNSSPSNTTCIHDDISAVSNSTTVDITVAELSCLDSESFLISCSSGQFSYKRSNNGETTLECFLATLNGHSTVELLRYWYNTFKSLPITGRLKGISKKTRSTNVVNVERYPTDVNSTIEDAVDVTDIVVNPADIVASSADIVGNSSDTVVIKTFTSCFEFSSVDFSLLLPDDKRLYLHVEFFNVIKNGQDLTKEIGIDSLSLQMIKGRKNTLDKDMDPKSHQWGQIINLGLYLTKIEDFKDQRKIWTKIEHLVIEWNLTVIKMLYDLLREFRPISNDQEQPSTSDETFASRDHPESSVGSASRDDEQKPSTSLYLNIQTNISDMILFVPVRDCVCFILSADECKVAHIKNTLSLNVVKLESYRRSINIKKPLYCTLDKSCFDISRISQMSLYYKSESKKLAIGSDRDIEISWSPHLHMILVESAKNVKQFVDDIKRRSAQSAQSSGDDSSIKKEPVQLKLFVEKILTLHFNLSTSNMQLVFNMFKMYKTGRKNSIATKRLSINCSGHSILTVQVLMSNRYPSHPKIDEFRQTCKDLVTKDNPIYLTEIESLSMVFPYGYNFAAAYDEVLNVFKWLKAIHGLKKKSFYPGQPLPCDFMIIIQTAYFEMCDDPFEVKLRDNYELLMDEYQECERRQQIMDQKIEELRKVQPLLLQRSKILELYTSLQATNSGIYVKRSKQLYSGQPSRTSLFNWKLTSVEIKALADESYHGETNFLKNAQSMNSESPWPPNITFNTAWCRYVGFDFKDWSMQMRDYPQPYWSMTDGHFWGRLAGAEMDGNERAKRGHVVSIGVPFEDYCVLRNMQAMKFYYDLCASIKLVKSAYGPCWEPCLTMINQCFDKIIRPSADPSPSLPFWDKIRFLWHGQLSMMIDQFIAAMLASSDPYDTTEQMEFSWRNFEFDWTNGVILVISDLDTYVRTASKYDDCCLLHLPALKLHIKMKWVCLGDPNDHHSVSPCAPDKLPDYSVHKIHDSYRSFRSQHLNLRLTLDIKNKKDVDFMPDSKRPSVLLYANTFRWLDGLKNTISAVNRPVKRGSLFKTVRQRRSQLSRHYRDIELSVSLPKFIISYWGSFSSDRGVRVIGQTLQLISLHRLGVASAKRKIDKLARRQQSTFRMIYMNAELINAEVFLFKKLAEGTANMLQSFFMSIHKLSYCRETTEETVTISSGNSTPRHKLIAYDLKASWTNSNRDVVLSILDGIQKARILRRNLSTDALKTVSIIEENSEKARPRRSFTSQQAAESSSISSPSGRFEGDHAADLLQQLIAETATKFMAYSEETSEIPSQQLHGIVLSQMEDILFTKWQIELINSQVMLKGTETRGYVLCTAAKAQIFQRFHAPVWRENQLMAKVIWTAMLSGMQYFATVGGRDNLLLGGSNGTTSEGVKWLGKDLIEERNCSDQTLDVVDSLLSQGHAAGGVVAESPANDNSLQLQRIVSRCNCQLYFCQFTDSAELDDIGDDVRPLAVDNDDEFWRRKEYVDCFTLKHNMLNISTNHLQYEMILDIINNLILYVDPKKKESAEKLLRNRFQLQLQSVDDLRPNISMLQNDVRQILLNQRYLERQMYLVNKQLNDKPGDSELLNIHAEIDEEMEKCKLDLLARSDDLAMTISCYREKQVQRQRQAQFRITDDQQQAQIARRFEVYFEDAQWRLTGDDGQIGLSDLYIRNFMYTKISRINDSGEHLLELGFLKIATLLPNSPYKDVLQPQHRSGTIPNDRIPAVRVICRELAPVGGISVKEHFEVNVVPMVVQMSYAFYRHMMNYFFPDRNIDTEDQQNLDTVDDQQSISGVDSDKSLRDSAKKAAKHANKAGGRKKRGKIDMEIKDDIDKMKKRAEKNNMFLYIKIPEVPFVVSYKGEKEKNIEDVENFQLEFPLVEYHDRNWTWLDLALAIKQRCKRVLLQQFMKQKLLKSRLGAAFGGSEPKLNPVDLPEEEKARMLLGTKLLGTPERSKQKTVHLFTSKSGKF